MIMCCFYTKFHMPSSNGSSVMALIQETKHGVHAVALFYILQETLYQKLQHFENLQPGEKYCTIFSQSLVDLS